MTSSPVETLLRAEELGAIEPGERRRLIEDALVIARERLGMDIGWVSEVASGDQIFRVVDAEDDSWAMVEGLRREFRHGYCESMLAGEIQTAVPDTSLDPITRELAATAAFGIGAYVGVPLVLSSGQVYGSLCCANHSPAQQLDDRDVRFMETLAGLIAGTIEARVLEAQRERERLRFTATDALIAALEVRDRYTGGHVREVVGLAVRVARRLGLDPDVVSATESVALLHDIGKVGVPDAVLHKDTCLDPGEWRILERHTVMGEELVAGVEALAHLGAAIRASHERWDGGGYPDGLAGEDIPIASRITFVCDAYDAIRSNRPYRAARSLPETVAELRANSGTQFWPDAVDALLAEVGEP